MAKETYYFSHDFNATSDPKMMRLLAVCGLQGIGMYWVIIEILHQQEDGIISYEAFKDYLQLYCHYDQDGGTSCINKIEQMLFKTELLFNKDGFVQSRRVLENKKMRKNISESRAFAGRMSAKSRGQQPKNKEVRTSVQQAVEQNPTKERKGKEIKGEREHALPISFEFLKGEVSRYCQHEKFSKFQPNDLAVKLSHVIRANGFEKSNGKKVRDWSSQIYLLMEKELEFAK